MRTIWVHLRDFWKKDFHAGAYALCIGLWLAALVWNYTDNWIIAHTYGQPEGWGRFWGFVGLFGAPYLIVLFLQALWGRGVEAFKQPGFWLMVFWGLAMIVVTAWAPFHKDLAKAWVPRELYTWGFVVLWNMKRFVFMLLPLLLYWLILEGDRKGFYGLWGGRPSIKAYSTVLLLLLPLIIGASFSQAFIETYPFYKPGKGEAALGVSPWVTGGIAELVYGSSFVFVEWVFRGFLVVGMMRWLGTHAVLPMVILYGCIHFGKPAGEALASVVGGYVLGASAYYSRSIWGGVIVHLGIAWAMDLMAILQRHVF